MTIAPQEPVLRQIAVDLKVLEEEHVTFVPMWLGYSLMISLKPGIVTDGASIPEWIAADEEQRRKVEKLVLKRFHNVETRSDFNSLVNRLIGTPWDMPRLLAAVVHDSLYGMKWMFRWLCDRVYRNILIDNSYELARAEVEYLAIRMFGWKNWKNISQTEQENTKRLASVAWVRTKNVKGMIEKLKQEGV